MPAFANIVVADGAGTPVNHTFAPVGINNGKASLADRAGGISLGYNTLDVTVVEPSKSSRLRKVRIAMKLPVLETVSGSTIGGIDPPPQVAFFDTVDCTFIVHERSSVQNRKDLRLMFMHALADAIIVSVIDDGTAIYG